MKLSILQFIILFQDILEPGNYKKVHFKFTRHPEYLVVGAKMLFREGTTKGIGTVTKLVSVGSNAVKVPILNSLLGPDVSTPHSV